MKFKPSYILAILIAVGVAGWMLSGNFMGQPEIVSTADGKNVDAKESAVSNAAGTAPDEVKTGPAKPTISAVIVENAAVRRSVRASGITQPVAVVTISSEVAGTITKIPAREGSAVKAGDILVVMDTGTLPMRIAAAKAEIVAAEAAYNSAVQQSAGTYAEEYAAAKANLEVASQRMKIGEKLVTQNFTAPVELAQLKANYENSRMALAKIELAQNFSAELVITQNNARLANAKSTLDMLQDQNKKSIIRAPSSGWLETLHVDVGEQMGSGMVAATILKMDTLKIVVAVPQTNISQISLGDPVSIDVAGVGRREGQVSKIASISSSATRTFDVEISVPNTDRSLRAGMTVEASIDIGYQPAFGMSPAHLSVAGDGSLTAKIDDGGIVRVVGVELVRSGVEQVFVSGLSDGDRLLTFGQAFVEAGEDVRVALEPTS